MNLNPEGSTVVAICILKSGEAGTVDVLSAPQPLIVSAYETGRLYRFRSAPTVVRTLVRIDFFRSKPNPKQLVEQAELDRYIQTHQECRYQLLAKEAAAVSSCRALADAGLGRNVKPTELADSVGLLAQAFLDQGQFQEALGYSLQQGQLLRDRSDESLRRGSASLAAARARVALDQLDQAQEAYAEAEKHLTSAKKTLGLRKDLDQARLEYLTLLKRIGASTDALEKRIRADAK
jgi:tetratricopeptide (TPR) repeat protein